MSAPRKVGDHWEHRFDLPPDPDTGERRQKQVSARTKAGCLAKERELRAQEAHQQAAPDRQSVDAYLIDWLEQVVRVTCAKQSTYHNYRTWLRLHVRPHLGTILLRRLSPEHCERWVAALVDAGCAPKSIHDYAAPLRKALTYAEQTGRIPRNPMRFVKLPPIPPPARTVWTQAEAYRFLAVAAQDTYHPFWLLAMTTAMRKSELLALRWRDLDLATGQLRIVRAYYPPNGQEDEPKTRAGSRSLYLDPETLEELHRHRAAQERLRGEIGPGRYEDRDLICAGITGHRIGYSTINKRMVVLVARAGVPYLSPHGLRHTNITRLLDAGMDIKVIRLRVGHADERTTRGVYYTVEDQAERRLAGGVRDAVFGASPTTARGADSG